MIVPAVTLSAALAVAAEPSAGDVDCLRAAALTSIARARAAADKSTSPVLREVTLPSIERLVEDADLRRANVTVNDCDEAFVRDTLKTARAYADRVAAGRRPLPPRDRRDGEGVPRRLGRHAAAVRALRAAQLRSRQALAADCGAARGVLEPAAQPAARVRPDNRPGETDEEAARNPLPLPDVPALVVSPFGRGELMGYDGLGADDATRVIADVRRAYYIDPDRMTLTGLSMGGGGTWSIGLRHPELFAALAPVCGTSDFVSTIPPSELPFYDVARLQALSPPAIAENAAHMQVMIFHGADDPTVPVEDSRKMAARYRALGWLGKNVSYTEYPGVKHDAWIPAYKDAALLRKLAGIRRDPAAPSGPLSPPPPGQAIPGRYGKSVPRQHPHLYVYGTHGAADAVAAARALAQALADWGPMVAARFTVKADRDVTAADWARFDLVLVGAAPFNALAPPVAAAPAQLGDRAFRALARRCGGAQQVRVGVRGGDARRVRAVAPVRGP